MGEFTEQIKRTAQNQDKIDIKLPHVMPVNGRLILWPVSKDKFKLDVKGSGLILPTHLAKESTDNRDSKNPVKDTRFFVVGWAPEVPEQMRLQLVKADGTADKVEIGIGDEVFLSEHMEPIGFTTNGRDIFYLIHWQDIICIEKSAMVKK